MNYISTRGFKESGVTSAEAIKRGLAPDGGLYMPESMPKITVEFLNSLLPLSYEERSALVLSLFLTDYTKQELMEDASSALEKGAVYRFEYVVKGTGVWGIKTDQTGWYPCVPMADQFSTGIVTYQAGSAKDCKLYLYAVGTTENMYLKLDSVKIYQVK